MGNKLYVGNLPYSVRDSDLEQSFGQFGTVTSAKVMMERDTGRSKGFGFVEMGSDAEALAAVEGMNGAPLGGRSLVVNEARPMEPRPPRSGGFGGSGDVGRRQGVLLQQNTGSHQACQGVFHRSEQPRSCNQVDCTGGWCGRVVGCDLQDQRPVMCGKQGSVQPNPLPG